MVRVAAARPAVAVGGSCALAAAVDAVVVVAAVDVGAAAVAAVGVVAAVAAAAAAAVGGGVVRQGVRMEWGSAGGAGGVELSKTGVFVNAGLAEARQVGDVVVVKSRRPGIWKEMLREGLRRTHLCGKGAVGKGY